jgi:hypothetical protein
MRQFPVDDDVRRESGTLGRVHHHHGSSFVVLSQFKVGPRTEKPVSAHKTRTNPP